MRNGSCEFLNPECYERVAISYNLLDEHGEIIERANPRSPLAKVLGPGESVDLAVKLVVPENLSRKAAQVRFSVMVEKRFWLFRLCPEHALDVPVATRVPKARRRLHPASRQDASARRTTTIPSVEDIAQYSELSADLLSVPRPMAFACGAYSPAITEQYEVEGRALSLGVYSAKRLMVVGSCGLQYHGETLACQSAGIFRAKLPRYREPDHVLRIAGTCVLFGPVYWNWGHWLIDHLPKLYLLQLAGWDLSRLNYLLPMDTPVWVDRLLLMIGIRADQLVRYTDAVKADEVLIPTKIRHLHAFSPALAEVQKFLFDRLAPFVDSSVSYDRLYFSRSDGNSYRVMQGEVEIEALVRKAGFRVLQPEKLPLAQQLGLYRHAMVIGGEYGSALHGSLFSEANPMVFGLKSTWPQPGFVQSGIGDVLDQPTGYIFGESRDRRVFTIQAADVEEALDIIASGGH